MLILRAPGATVGLPLLIGAVGVLLIGQPHWVQSLRSIGDDALGLEGLALDPPHRVGWTWLALHVAWVALGVCIAVRVAPSLTESSAPDRPRRLTSTLRSLVRVFSALGLLVVAAAPFGLALWALAAAPAPISAATRDVAAALAAAPVAIAWLLSVVGAPLLVAAVVIDGADPFDAVSRTAAYTLQRPFTLAWCLLVACVAGAGGGVVVESVVRGIDAVMHAFGVPPVEAGSSTTAPLFAAALRGFYPAYIFTAGVAVYLVMRKAIDGQPLDEMADSQPSDPA